METAHPYLQYSSRDRQIIKYPATITLKVMLLFVFAKGFAISSQRCFLSSRTTLPQIALEQVKETAILFSLRLTHSPNEHGTINT